MPAILFSPFLTGFTVFVTSESQMKLNPKFRVYTDIRVTLYVNFRAMRRKNSFSEFHRFFFHYINIFVKKRSIRSGGSRGLHKEGGGELIIFSVGKAPRHKTVERGDDSGRVIILR